MGITVEWDNPEKTIVLFTNEGNQNWEEFFPAAREATEMIRSVPHEVTLIIDGRNLKSIPPSALTNFRNAMNSLPPNTKLVIGVVTNPFIRAIGNIVEKVTKKGMVSVNTLEEARALARGDAKQV